MRFVSWVVAVAALFVAACSAPPLSPCTQCGGECVDTRVDPRHCGSCEKPCAAGALCREGACVATCAAGQTACSGKCADTRNDPVNCGGCGTTCSAGQACVASMCQSVCPSGQDMCSGACVTTMTDNAHCGGCNQPCAAGSRCAGGSCRVQCQPNQLSCDGGACVNGATDNQNCGVCGRACAAGQVCSGGMCGTTCAMNLTLCTPDGGAPSCADTQNDNANCGMCGRACSAGQSCFQGTCSAFCMAGLTVCPSGASATPTCVDVTTNPEHCGVCGAACAGACQSGLCVPAAATQLTGNVNLSAVSLGARTCAQGGEMVRYPVTALTSLTATLATAPAAGCLAAGDELLLIDQQASAPLLPDGGAIANPNVGNWELVRVASVNGSTVTFRTPKQRFYGEGASDDVGVGVTQRVVAQRVPAFSTFEYSFGADGGVLTADAWDAGTGIFALRATTAVNLTGVLDMRGKGFTGAPRVAIVGTSGRQGEGPFGPGLQDDRNALGAGGGGRGENTGCWQTFGTAGGGAGHALTGAKPAPHCSGTGGSAMGSPLLSKVFLGPGGGSGGTDATLFDNPPGGRGGRGGGAVLLFTPRLTSSVRIDVSGTEGEGDTPGRNCIGPSPTDCWDFSGPGGGGAGGTFYLSGIFASGASTVVYNGGSGGDGSVVGAGIGGRGSIGRVLPLPQSCADVSAAMGDGEYVLALGGDPTRPYTAYCAGGRTYLTLLNTQPGSNESNYDATSFGPPTNTLIKTRFQKVRFDPGTRRLIADDYTFSTSQGQGTAGPFGATVVTRLALATAGNCVGTATPPVTNLDLRGLPFQITTNNAWVSQGSNPYGTSSFLYDRQVLNASGGGACGAIGPRTFPNGEIELSYLAPRASCQAIKTASPTFPSGVYALSPDPAYPVLPVYCEQTAQGGGWALVQDNGPPTGVQLMRNYIEATPVVAATAGYVPVAVLRTLASSSTQIYLRTYNDNNRSIMSVANSAAIQNLRLGNLLLQQGQLQLTDFTGTFAAGMVLNQTCPVVTKGWPNVYHACGNPTGLHWLNDVAKWNNAQLIDEPLELFVR